MKMRFCTYCGGLLDENTGVCPKCFGGIDAPKQEEQAAELTAIPKVDLGDGPFATAPSSIPTLTLDPFGTSSASGDSSQIQLNLSTASLQTGAETVPPQLEIPSAPNPSEAGSGITLSLHPDFSVEAQPKAAEPVKTEETTEETAPETTVSDVGTGPLEFSAKKPTTKFEEMVAKIQADQERIQRERAAGQAQAVPASDAAAEAAQARQAQQPQAAPQQSLQDQYAQARQAQQPQAAPQQSLQDQYAQAKQQGAIPMQAPQNSYENPAPAPMPAPTYGQPYTQPQAAQYSQTQTAQSAQYGQQAPMYGRQTPPYGQPQNAQYSQQGAYGQPYHSPQTGAYPQAMPGYGMQGDASASPEAVQEYMQRPASYANPAYVDQEVTYNTQYGQPVDPRFSQTVNMNMQYNPAQAPVLYQQQNPAFVTPGTPIPSIEEKNRVTAGILALVLGQFGAHKFYMNHPSAIWYLLITLFTCGVGGAVIWIISLIEGIGYLGMSDEEFKQKLYEEFYKTQQ